MKLRWIGTESGKTGCPSLFETDRDTYVVQGWRVTDPDALAALDIPGHETVIEVPKGLMRYLPKEGRGASDG